MSSHEFPSFGNASSVEKPVRSLQEQRSEREELEAALSTSSVLRREQEAGLPVERIEIEIKKHRHVLALYDDELRHMRATGANEAEIADTQFARSLRAYDVEDLEWLRTERLQEIVDHFLSKSQRYLNEGDPHVAVDRLESGSVEELRTDLEMAQTFLHQASESLQIARHYMEDARPQNSNEQAQDYPLAE